MCAHSFSSLIAPEGLFATAEGVVTSRGEEPLSISCKIFKLLFVSVYLHNCLYTNGILPDKISCRLPSLNFELIQAFA